MTSIRLIPEAVEKPWGRTDLPSQFHAGQARIGEIWFKNPPSSDRPILVKMLYTSERLSIQVHPNDAEAQTMGHAGGKSECWYVVHAEPGATLGIGLRRRVTKAELETANLDGSIIDLMDWKPAKAGDFYYIPAGTIHAIGAGLTLVEIQQNNDVTYRLFDYGRPRPLQLQEGLAVTSLDSYDAPGLMVSHTQSRKLVARSDAPFQVESVVAGRETCLRVDGGPAWFVPLSGNGLLDGAPWRSQQCWLIEDIAEIEVLADMHGLLAWSKDGPL